MRSKSVLIALMMLPSTGCFVLVPFIEPYKEPESANYHARGSYQTSSTSPKSAPSNRSARYVNRHIKQLDSPSAPKRSAAASYLGMIGPDAAPAIPALIARLDDESKFVRRAVVKALGKIGVRSTQVLDALNRAMSDRDRYVAKSAQNALAQLNAKPGSTEIVSGSPVYTIRSNRRVE